MENEAKLKMKEKMRLFVLMDCVKSAGLYNDPIVTELKSAKNLMVFIGQQSK